MNAPDRIPILMAMNPWAVIVLILAVGFVPMFTKHPAVVRTVMVAGFLSLLVIPTTGGAS